MSNENKLHWLEVVLLVVIVGMIGYLAVVNHVRTSENGLECIYNCNDYPLMLDSLN